MAIKLVGLTLEEFAKTVLKAAQDPTTKRWHSEIYISSVYETLGGSATGIDLAEFKRCLFEAHQTDLLELSRADLVETMTAELLQASEIKVSNYSFHFIRL